MSGYVDTLNAAWEQHLAPRAITAPTVISTFAGCGGSSLGYSMAGYRELLAVEWDDNAVATFGLNFPEVPIYHGDIANLSVDECLCLAEVKPGDLDVLDGSPPCQGFSTAGKRVLDDPRNGLFREYVRLLRGLMPKVFVMENVSGMVKGKMKLVFAEIMRELKASGYQVSARLMNAMYFNVPQSRERMIFVGVRNDLRVMPSHPVAISRPVSVGDAIFASDAIIGVTGRVGTGYKRRPIDLTAPSLTIKASDAAQTRYEVEYRKTDRIVHDTSGTHSQGDVTDGPAQQVLAHRAGTHWIVSNSSYRETHKPVTEPSPLSSATVPDASLISGTERRRFTIDEVKRICSYPDAFQMVGSYSEQWARLGNSVPPLFLRAVAEHIRDNLLTVSLDSALAAD